MREAVTAADCRSCGACCWSREDSGDGIASVEPADRERMGSRRVRLHVLGDATAAEWKPQRSGALAGHRALVCSALRGSLFSRVSCAMYDVRPEVCRRYEPGSRWCLGARRALRVAIEGL